MTSSPPFLRELRARPPSLFGKCRSDFPFLPGSPPPSRKGVNSLTLELPLVPRKGYSDHPALTPGLSPNPGKRCSDSSHPLGCPPCSRQPFSGPACCPGISSVTGTPPSLPRPIPSPPPPPPSPPPQPPLRPGRCSFEPSSPLLGRPCCPEPILPGSSPLSPCFDRFSLLQSPPLCPRSPCCGWISSPRTPCPCPRSPSVTSPPLTHRPPGTSPVTSPPLTCVPLETAGTVISPSITLGSQGTCPMISPPLTHRPLGTGLVISPPLSHRPMETRAIISPPLSHRVLETGIMISPPLSPWSSGRSYNDPPLSQASSPPTGSFYHGHLKPPDSYEPKPQLDSPCGKNYCGAPLSSQAGTSGCPSSPPEGSHHCSHLPPETHIPAPGSPCGAIRLPPGSTGSPCSPQSQASRKPCFGSTFSWETAGSPYLFVTPVAMISGPPCPQEPPLPLSSPCPCSAFSFPSPLGNQLISPPQSPPSRSYNEPPLPTPACPQVKSPKSSELRQPRAPHRSRSLVTPLQQTPPDEPTPPKASTSPPPPSCSSDLSGASCIVTSVTTCSNSCPKELPQGTAVPTVVPTILKTVIPTSLPPRLPCDPVPPNSCAQSSPRGPLLRSPCSTHVYSVIPPTPNPCPLSDSLSQSTGPPQCHRQPMVPHCGPPRGPPQPRRQSVAPPCSTHIYSCIPLRTPFDLQSLPIAPRARGRPDAMPCGLHVYSVASRGSCKESPQIPYSCPLPSSKSSSCSSTIIINECQSSDSQRKNTHESRSRSPSESPHRCSGSESQSKSFHPSRSQNRSKSPSENENWTRHKGSRSRSGSHSGHRHHGRSKSPRHRKK
uniref:Uncharacterized protein n=1 Tax=Equus asinus asinus TaxID=83772 RepID=A0A8C4LBA1_EQUAS